MCCMCKPWKKMTKDEKQMYIQKKIMMGVAIFLFGLIWNYFAGVYVDVWRGLPVTLAVMGILCILYAFFKKSST